MPGLTAAPAKPRPRLPAWLRTRLPTTDSFRAHPRAAGRTEAAHRLPERDVPEPLGVLEQRHRDLHDRRRPLHPGLRLLRSNDRQTFGAGGGRAARVAEATQRLRLRHVVITAVARDDLADGGAEHFRRTIEAVRALNPATVIEVLTPDFNEREEAINTVLAGRPHIFNHNLETVRRLTPAVRSRATYDRSLSVLAKVKAKCGGAVYTKSGLMLGLGETEEELFTALADLREAGCDMLTLGQYLQPTLKHLPVAEFVTPEKFAEYGSRAREMGFVHVASAPMVRSSYHADEFTLPGTTVPLPEPKRASTLE